MNHNKLSYIPIEWKVKVFQSKDWIQNISNASFKELWEMSESLHSIGSIYGEEQIPTRFLMIIMKFLQLSPYVDTILPTLSSTPKYVQALLLLYVRMTASPLLTYQTLEPYYSQYHPLQVRSKSGELHTLYLDEWVDQLLLQSTVLGYYLPKLPPRSQFHHQLSLIRPSPLFNEWLLMKGSYPTPSQSILPIPSSDPTKRKKLKGIPFKK